MTKWSQSGIIPVMDDLAELRRQLEELRSEHRDWMTSSGGWWSAVLTISCRCSA
jgi:hypothetical protein